MPRSLLFPGRSILNQNLEIGWLPPLSQNAHNPKIEVGQSGRVQASGGAGPASVSFMTLATTRPN